MDARQERGLEPALGTTAPVASFNTPSTVAVGSCARTIEMPAQNKMRGTTRPMVR